MAAVNKAIILGNLGSDPEVRSLPSGQAVAEFSVATNRKWNDRDGNRQEETEWHNVVCFGRQAEIAGQYLSKGSKVFIEGRLKTDKWEDRDTGKTMYKTRIVAFNFQMLGGSRDSSGGGYSGGSGGGQTSFGGDSSGFGGDGGGFDDDIPF